MKMSDILQRPIPYMDAARERRGAKTYRRYPLATIAGISDEEVVDIARYAVAGQSYYSRPNRATTEPLAEVKSAIMVRKEVALRLSEINFALQQSTDATELFGGTVELYVDEGMRSQAVQTKLHDEVFPRLIAAQHSELSLTEQRAIRDRMIGRPSSSILPAPHATGAAVDLKFRYIQQSNLFVPKTEVPVGGTSANDGAQPDYFEKLESRQVLTSKQKKAQYNRRAFYWIMRGALLGKDTGFAVNPQEWWHWSYGDQMWAAVTEAPCAFYGAAERSPVSE